MDCSPPGSSVHGITQARILEWVAVSFSLSHLRSPQITIYFNFLNPLKTKQHRIQNSPGSPVAKNLPSNAGDTGPIPYWGNKIPHDTELSQHPTATQPSCSRARALQLEKPLCTTTRERLHAATKIQYSQEINKMKRRVLF